MVTDANVSASFFKFDYDQLHNRIIAITADGSDQQFLYNKMLNNGQGDPTLTHKITIGGENL